MTYNILNYRNGTSYCTGSNNSSSTKESGIQTIVNYVQPDVVVFNEVGSGANSATYLLNNALNTGSTSSWAMCPYTNSGNSPLVNAIAYNSDRLLLDKQYTITKDLNNTNLVRLIDVLRFKVIDSLWNGVSFADTLSFYVVAAHLKAGSTSSDETARALATEAVIDWIDNQFNANASINLLMMGDLNTYSSNEACYQNLTAGSTFRFEDPLNSSGNWHNSSGFAPMHTQSTSTATSGCKSGGGLDDRFDHILISEAISEGEAGMTYEPNTYITIGNDGNHFNEAVNSNTNYSVSTTVLGALASVSDHLPVILDVEIEIGALSITEDFRVKNLPNPVQGNYQWPNPELAKVQIFNTTGQMLFESSQEVITFPNLPKGMYLFRTRNGNRIQLAKILY
jgi:endonuclease/exonuclease/phosphatase family metal-dependent hydrolase